MLRPTAEGEVWFMAETQDLVVIGGAGGFLAQVSTQEFSVAFTPSSRWVGNPPHHSVPLCFAGSRTRLERRKRDYKRSNSFLTAWRSW